MRLDVPMAENLISALAYLPCGLTLVRMMGDDIALMPDDYRLIAERLVTYWKSYKKAPGVHAVDLFADIVGNPSHPKKDAVTYILQEAFKIKDGLNPDYVVSRLSGYLRYEAISSTIIEVSAHMDRHRGNEVLAAAEAEEMLNKLIKARRVEFDPGLGLEDVPSFIDLLEHKEGVYLRIKPLDRINVMPQRGTLFVLVGVTGRGKTWFLVHTGAQALHQGMKVAHISLEISAPDVLGRYYQSLFKASEHVARYAVTELRTDDYGSIVGMDQHDDVPDFTFRDEDRLINPELSRELEARFERLGTNVDNLRIRAWPPQTVTVDTIEGWLDTMADTHHWEPDLLLVDYPKLLKFKNPDTFRLELGHAVENLRRLAQERNMAVVMVHQATRKGAEAKTVGLTHISEDWSIVQTADTVLSYSATEEEEARGLGRLHIDKARAPRSKGMKVLLTQAYDLGQFVRSAVAMPSNYQSYLESQRNVRPAPAAEEEKEMDSVFDQETAQR